MIGNNALHGTAQGILLVVVRGPGDILMAVKLSVVLVLELKRNMSSTSAAAKKTLEQPMSRIAYLSTLEPLVFS